MECAGRSSVEKENGELLASLSTRPWALGCSGKQNSYAGIITRPNIL